MLFPKIFPRGGKMHYCSDNVNGGVAFPREKERVYSDRLLTYTCNLKMKRNKEILLFGSFCIVWHVSRVVLVKKTFFRFLPVNVQYLAITPRHYTDNIPHLIICVRVCIWQRLIGQKCYAI